MRKTRFLFSLLSISAATLAGIPSSGQQSLHLDGTWQMGEHRTYVKEVRVPGIHCDPAQMNRDTLWYRREVKLPDGKWEYATLELKGARFAPAVFVDGVQVSRADGGMAPTFHLLGSPAVRPGQTVVLEIALTSLRDLPVSDASYIAESDHWRSNISSSLWDSVILHFHGDHRVTNLIPDADPEAKRLALYEIQITLNQGGRATDCFERKLGVKRFEVRDRQFYLNGKPCKIRGGSITWHRWMRSPEGSASSGLRVYQGIPSTVMLTMVLPSSSSGSVFLSLAIAYNTSCSSTGLSSVFRISSMMAAIWGAQGSSLPIRLRKLLPRPTKGRRYPSSMTSPTPATALSEKTIASTRISRCSTCQPCSSALLKMMRSPPETSKDWPLA